MRFEGFQKMRNLFRLHVNSIIISSHCFYGLMTNVRFEYFLNGLGNYLCFEKNLSQFYHQIYNAFFSAIIRRNFLIFLCYFFFYEFLRNEVSFDFNAQMTGKSLVVAQAKITVQRVDRIIIPVKEFHKFDEKHYEVDLLQRIMNFRFINQQSL